MTTIRALISIPEAAAYIGIGKSTFYKLMAVRFPRLSVDCGIRSFPVTVPGVRRALSGGSCRNGGDLFRFHFSAHADY